MCSHACFFEYFVLFEERHSLMIAEAFAHSLTGEASCQPSWLRVWRVTTAFRCTKNEMKQEVHGAGGGFSKAQNAIGPTRPPLERKQQFV